MEVVPDGSPRYIHFPDGILIHQIAGHRLHRRWSLPYRCWIPGKSGSRLPARSRWFPWWTAFSSSYPPGVLWQNVPVRKSEFLRMQIFPLNWSVYLQWRRYQDQIHRWCLHHKRYRSCGVHSPSSAVAVTDGLSCLPGYGRHPCLPWTHRNRYA